MAALELAPHHKTGLTLASPVMPAAGCFGYGAEYASLVDQGMLGALVVGPVTAGPRRGAAPPRIVPLAGGLLFHTGLANPGVAAVVRRYGRIWARSPVPVIVHVAGVSPDEAAACCRRLSGIEAVAAVELGLPDSADPADLAAIVRAARAAASQPLIVRLPLMGAEVLCEVAAEAGADALTVAAPPRGSVWVEPAGRFVSGRLYGAFVLPQVVRALRGVAGRVSLPLVGCGGVYCVEDALVLFRAGAMVVQVDAALWRDPACLSIIAQGVAKAAQAA